MPHSEVSLAGPLWWFAVALFAGAWLFSGFVTLDSLRRSRSAELVTPSWVYTLLGGLFFLGVTVLFLMQVAGLITPELAIAAAVSMPFTIIVGVVYLLKVVFPKG